ncbi:MAG: hypothetical protein ACSHWY_01985 [Octadecabacter sp.]
MTPDILTTTLIDDSARFIHLLAVAIGIGASFFADFTVLQNIKRPVINPLIQMLHSCHRIVWGALIVMWASGLALIYLRTNFVLSNFSPKLFTKILVVSVLAINAILIGKFAMPTFARMQGRSPLDMPLRHKLPLACMAGVSTLSWLLALALGSSRFLAQGSADLFYVLISASYGGCLVVALAASYALHRTLGRPAVSSPAVLATID